MEKENKNEFESIDIKDSRGKTEKTVFIIILIIFMISLELYLYFYKIKNINFSNSNKINYDDQSYNENQPSNLEEEINYEENNKYELCDGCEYLIKDGDEDKELILKISNDDLYKDFLSSIYKKAKHDNYVYLNSDFLCDSDITTYAKCKYFSWYASMNKNKEDTINIEIKENIISINYHDKVENIDFKDKFDEMPISVEAESPSEFGIDYYTLIFVLTDKNNLYSIMPTFVDNDINIEDENINLIAKNVENFDIVSIPKLGDTLLYQDLDNEIYYSELYMDEENISKFNFKNNYFDYHIFGSLEYNVLISNNNDNNYIRYNNKVIDTKYIFASVYDDEDDYYTPDFDLIIIDNDNNLYFIETYKYNNNYIIIEKNDELVKNIKYDSSNSKINIYFENGNKNNYYAKPIYYEKLYYDDDISKFDALYNIDENIVYGNLIDTYYEADDSYIELYDNKTYKSFDHGEIKNGTYKVKNNKYTFSSLENKMILYNDRLYEELSIFDDENLYNIFMKKPDLDNMIKKTTDIILKDILSKDSNYERFADFTDAKLNIELFETYDYKGKGYFVSAYAMLYVKDYSKDKCDEYIEHASGSSIDCLDDYMERWNFFSIYDNKFGGTFTGL